MGTYLETFCVLLLRCRALFFFCAFHSLSTKDVHVRRFLDSSHLCGGPRAVMRRRNTSLLLSFFLFPDIELVWRGRDDKALYQLFKKCLDHAPWLLLEDNDLFWLFCETQLRYRTLHAPLSIDFTRTFRLDDWNVSHAREFFRFEPAAIRLMAGFFLGTEQLRTDARGVGDEKHANTYMPEEGLCMFLWRMASPAKLSEAMKYFFRSRSSISRICNDVARRLHLIAVPCLSGIYTEEIVERYLEWREAIARVSELDVGVYALIDGKLFVFAHTSQLDGAFYSGYYKKFGAKFLAVAAPNGMLIALHGPEAGRHHDSWCIDESGWFRPLRDLDAQLRGENYRRDGHARIGAAILGDSAFPRTQGLMAMYKEPELNGRPRRQLFQQKMKSARGEIEHWFAHVILNWRHLANELEMKMQSRPVFSYVWACSLMSNCLTAARGGNQISAKFSVPPPTLMEYLESLLKRSRAMAGRF